MSHEVAPRTTEARAVAEDAQRAEKQRRVAAMRREAQSVFRSHRRLVPRTVAGGVAGRLPTSEQ